MNEEEKEAIETVKGITTDDLLNYWEGSEEPYEAIQIVLNLINKQSKVIEEMAKDLNAQTLKKEMWCPLKNKNFELYGKLACSADMTCLKCLKQYFYRKVEEDVKNKR